MSKLQLFLAVALLSCTVTAYSADTPVDIDLRQAAMLHRDGNTPAAIAIWKKRAEQGHVDAAYNLAVIHQHADGVAYDAGQALRWYRYAAERGDKVSRLKLGLMYQNGEGVPADQAKAHDWFTKDRQEHAHHHHHPQYIAWQEQSRKLLDARDRREAVALAQRSGAQVLATLRQRAGMVSESTRLAKRAEGVVY